MKSKLLFLFLALAFLGKAQTFLNYNWAHGFGSNSNVNYMGASCVDASGNMYMSGRMNGTIDFDPGPGTSTVSGNSSYIAKYDASGNLVWYKILVGPGFLKASGIGVDASNNIYITGELNYDVVDFDPGPGTVTLTPTYEDMFIAKYDPSGNYIWAKQISGTGSGSVKPYGMNVSSTGEMVITGEFSDLVDFDAGPGVDNESNYGGEASDAFVTKYDASGNYVFAFTIYSANSERGHNLDLDGSGNIYVTGEYYDEANFDPAGTYTLSSAGEEDIFLAKYTPAGALVWAKGMGGEYKDFGYKIKCNNAGEIVLSGAIQSATIDADPSPAVYTITKVGPPGNNDTYLAKYNASNGAFIWGYNTGANPGDVITSGLAVDVQNNIYIGGYYTNTADFDFGPGTATLALVIPNGNDFFIAKYDNAGSFKYVKQIGGAAYPSNTLTALHLRNNDIYISGEFADQLDTDPEAGVQTMTASGYTDFFIAKYTECTLPTSPILSLFSATVCAGTNTSIAVISGSLNSATNWQWYTGSCGGTPVGSGATLAISPTITTTYFVRGEGGCVVPGNCIPAPVTVLPLKNISGQVTTNTMTPVAISGSVTLYKFESYFTKFDSITTQQLDPQGNYTLTSVPSASYIILATPTDNSLQTTYSGNATDWKSAVSFTNGCANNVTHNVSVKALTNFGTGIGMLTGKIVEGAKYGQKGTNIAIPGNPIKGISVKCGRNPGGDIGQQGRSNSSGDYSITGLPQNSVGESYYLIVDIPGLDTNSTYHKVVVTGSEVYTELDFVVDSARIHPMVFVGLNEKQIIQTKNFRVYPNPASSQIMIECSLESPAEIKAELVDMLGRTVQTILPATYERDKNITIIGNVSGVKPGIYFIKLKAGSQETVSKIVIE